LEERWIENLAKYAPTRHVSRLIKSRGFSKYSPTPHPELVEGRGEKERECEAKN